MVGIVIGIGVGMGRGVGMRRRDEEYGSLLYGTTDTAITDIKPFLYLLTASVDSEGFLNISGWIVRI